MNEYTEVESGIERLKFIKSYAKSVLTAVTATEPIPKEKLISVGELFDCVGAVEPKEIYDAIHAIADSALVWAAQDLREAGKI